MTSLLSRIRWLKPLEINSRASEGDIMAKGYWVVLYRRVSDPEAIARYAKPAGAAIQAGGGKILARGEAVEVFEAGLKERSVVIEFESAAKAIEVYNSTEY